MQSSSESSDSESVASDQNRSGSESENENSNNSSETDSGATYSADNEGVARSEHTQPDTLPPERVRSLLETSDALERRIAKLEEEGSTALVTALREAVLPAKRAMRALHIASGWHPLMPMLCILWLAAGDEEVGLPEEESQIDDTESIPGYQSVDEGQVSTLVKCMMLTFEQQKETIAEGIQQKLDEYKAQRQRPEPRKLPTLRMAHV